MLGDSHSPRTGSIEETGVIAPDLDINTFDYSFLDFIREDKSKYKTAKECGYIDDDNLFLVGSSGGFLMNIDPEWKFINTELFSPAAEYFRNNGFRYTSFRQDSISHRQFRKREEYRREFGFSAPCLINSTGKIKNVRITGNHYNFLNYGRMRQLDETTIKTGNTNVASKTYDFPKFFDSQFWMFHILEFAKNNGFHFLACKTRRGGFSYIMASCAANAVNIRPKRTVINVAIDSKYLTQTDGLTSFATDGLRFYEEKTPFVRGIYSSVKSDFKLGYKLPNGVEANDSWGSSLISVSAANNPNCAIGKDAVEVNVEEISTMDNFDEFMAVTEPAMRTGAYTTGFLKGWGTATSNNMQTFESNFFNVSAYNFMPFENVWDRDKRDETCGFFKPYCWGLQGEIDGQKGVDEYGNSNLEIGLKISLRERIAKKKSAKQHSDYISYLGQYANTPSESFNSVTENIFSSEELSAWEHRLKTDKDLQFHVDGMLEFDDSNVVIFKSNERLRKEGKRTYKYIENVPRKSKDEPYGCIRRWFPPESVLVDDGTGRMVKRIPKGLYSISYDPVGIDKDRKQITSRHSHNSIKVWMNPHSSNGYIPKLVASYYGRPERLEEADRICYMLAVYYNCDGTTNVETNRGETVSNFRIWKALHYLGRQPLFIFDTSLKGKYNTNYGFTMPDGDYKLNSIRLLKEMLYKQIGVDEQGNPIRLFHKIYDYPSILELKKWNTEGNYDRVSEMLIRAIEYKAIELIRSWELVNKVEISQSTQPNGIFNREWF